MKPSALHKNSNPDVANHFNIHEKLSILAFYSTKLDNMNIPQQMQPCKQNTEGNGPIFYTH